MQERAGGQLTGRQIGGHGGPGAVTQMAGGEVAEQPICKGLSANQEKYRSHVMEALIVASAAGRMRNCSCQHTLQLLPSDAALLIGPALCEGP